MPTTAADIRELLIDHEVLRLTTGLVDTDVPPENLINMSELDPSLTGLKTESYMGGADLLAALEYSVCEYDRVQALKGWLAPVSKELSKEQHRLHRDRIEKLLDKKMKEEGLVLDEGLPTDMLKMPDDFHAKANIFRITSLCLQSVTYWPGKSYC